MARMIGDLLDYTCTRLGTGTPVSPVPMDMADLGRALYDESHSAYADRVVCFRVEGDTHGTWDADRIR